MRLEGNLGAVAPQKVACSNTHETPKRSVSSHLKCLMSPWTGQLRSVNGVTLNFFYNLCQKQQKNGLKLKNGPSNYFIGSYMQLGGTYGIVGPKNVVCSNTLNSVSYTHLTLPTIYSV